MASIRHGTESAYEWHDCRCDRCRLRHNERVRRNRAERLAAGRLTHGTRSAYDAGCRCDQCRVAKADADALYKRRVREREARLTGPVAIARRQEAS
jgi:hypothetical protein